MDNIFVILTNSHQSHPTYNANKMNLFSIINSPDKTTLSITPPSFSEIIVAPV